MPYDRVYRLQEVHDILCKSERRNKPGGHYAGHSIGLHADGRDDVTDRRYKSTILLAGRSSRRGPPGPKMRSEASSRFTRQPLKRRGVRLACADLIRAVEQALNSA